MSGSIVVTGALGALGQSVVKVLSGAGWNVVGLDARPADGSEGPAFFGGVDLTDSRKTEAVAEAIAQDFGGVAGLVNVAGGFIWKPFSEATSDDFDRMYAINLKTMTVASRAFLPFLEESSGAIVNIGAAAAGNPGEGFAAYAASKAGVAAVTKSLAAELKPKGVRVNAVLPTILDTPTNRADMPDEDFSKWVTTEAAAEVIAFLLSPAAAAVTGAEIPLS